MDFSEYEDVSEEFIQIIEAIGLDNAMKITNIAGGSNLYIPLSKTLERPSRNKKIREEFNGYNNRKLALKYNVSEATIRIICKDIIDKKRKQPIDGQLSMFNTYT